MVTFNVFQNKLFLVTFEGSYFCIDKYQQESHKMKNDENMFKKKTLKHCRFLLSCLAHAG